MKGLIKLFSAAAFVGALASCSDDLSLNRALNLDPDADFYAYFDEGETTRMGALNDAGMSIVWNQGDQIKLYSPEALAPDIYEISSGWGTATGSFDIIKSNGVAGKSGLVAITSGNEEADNRVKVYATDDGKMGLIAKIPASFAQSEKVGGNITPIIYWPLAIPYWANSANKAGTEPIVMDDNNKLHAYMKGLTGLLKIDIKDLPEGTTAIVLNTHYYAYTKEADYLEHVGTAAYEKYNINGKKTGKELGGMDEPLSGTLSTILEDGCKLTVDEDFKHDDTLRVDFDMLQNVEDKIIYVPIVAQHYEKLTVLALTGRSDSEYPYVWPGAEVLNVFTNLDVQPGQKLRLAQTAPIETKYTDTKELSRFIANRIGSDGKHTVKIVNTAKITTASTPLYIPNNNTLPAGWRTSVDIEFTQPSDVDFDIVEATPNYSVNSAVWTLDGNTPWLDNEFGPDYLYGYKSNHARFDVKSQDMERKATIIFAQGEEKKHNIILPSSNVVLKVGARSGVTMEGGFTMDDHTTGLMTGDIYILGSNTRQVSGYTDDEEGEWDTPRNYQNAGIVISGSYGNITIHPNQFGDVFASGDNLDDEIQTLTFKGSFIRNSVSSLDEPQTESMNGYDTQIDLRITDMLIKDIKYPNIATNGESNIYTTGSAAIKTITEANQYQCNHVNLHASWTSKQLTNFALNAGYDQSKIFTAAQLSSMGLASLRKSEGATITPDSPYDYYMSEFTRSVWLGGTEFPWLGADVTIREAGAVASITPAFTFDGRNCNFRNMYNDLYLGWIPYDCCCDDNNNRVKIREGLGLIRRIDTKKYVVIENVDLTDALIKADKFNIRNIGSICGRISADDVAPDGNAILLQNNSVDDVRIDALGRNIGGAFGWLNTAKKVKIDGLHVGENGPIFGKSWVTSKEKNVGGAVGLISGDEIPYVTYVEWYGDRYLYTLWNNRNKAIEYDKMWDFAQELEALSTDVYEEYVLSEDDNVGGQVGCVFAKILKYGNNKLDNMKTHMNDRIRTIGSNVGGLIGDAHYWGGDKDKVRGTVEVNNEIYALYDTERYNQDNSNLSGSNVGGLVGCLINPAAYNISDPQYFTEVEGDVCVAGYVIATNRNAGGFVGLYEANALRIGTGADGKASGNANAVNIGKRLQAVEGYVGGLIGDLNTASEAKIGHNATTGSINLGAGKELTGYGTVKFGEIAGAMAVGGLIGSNSNGSATAANDKQLQIVSKKNDYVISINIDQWTNTKHGIVVLTNYTRDAKGWQLIGTESNLAIDYPKWYTKTGQQKYAGSFGTVIGWLNNVINITDAGLSVTAKTNVLAKFSRTATNYWGAPEYTSKNPIFTNNKKLDLLFTLQNVSQATQIEEAITGQGTFFWGDANGYVGVVANSAAGGGAYKLNSNTLKGSTDYNCYWDWTTNLTSNDDLWP